MESKVNDYQLRQGDKLYIFSTCIVENAVRLSCKNHAGKNYSRDFTVYEINAIDPLFSEIKSEIEAIKFIDKALGVHKVGVSEESGIVKIIFYVQNKGLIHSIEIPLGESGKSLLQSKLDNLSTDNALTSTAQMGEASQPIEFTSQTYGNSNYSTGNINSYGQQSFYSTPIITPVEGETISDTNYNIDQFMSQYQVSGNSGFYEGGTQYETGTGFTGTNFENIGSFIQQDTNQYLQYDTSNDSSSFGIKSLPVEYFPNSNSYEYTSNQYSTLDNNYYQTNYDSSYQVTNNTYETNSYNYPTTSNQYTQSAIEETAYNGQEYQTYENTASVTSLNNNVLPTITPADPIETSNYIQTSQYGTHSTPVKTVSLHSPLKEGSNTKYEASTNIGSNSKKDQGMNSQMAQATKLTNASVNNKIVQEQTTTTTQSKIITSQNNLQSTSPKKENVSPGIKIDELELQKLKEEAAEAAILRKQLAELEPLKQQVEEMDELKKQLEELDSLREQVAEMNIMKSQLVELKELRQQVGQMNILREQLDELNSLRSQVAIIDSLKKRIEELENIKMEYEQEIKELRESMRQTENMIEKSDSNMASKVSKGLDSKHITFEEETQHVCVKGDIIHDTRELEMLTRKINKLNKKLTLNLLYKASADTDRAMAFHAKCDDAKSTIVLIETDKGKRFGGFTSCSWSGDCEEKKDEEAFVFSLDKMKTYDSIPGEDAIGCYPKFGPIFLGCQIRIYDNAFSKGGTTFEKGLNFNTEEDFELTGGDRIFNVKEIEVYEVIPQ